MAIIDDFLKRNVVVGLAIGVGALLLAPVVLPVVARLAKPVAKAAIKTGLIMYRKGCETVAELGEMTEDIVAEAQAELAHEEAGRAEAPLAAGGPAAEGPGTQGD
jgi:hypothetical protein